MLLAIKVNWNGNYRRFVVPKLGNAKFTSRRLIMERIGLLAEELCSMLKNMLELEPKYGMEVNYERFAISKIHILLSTYTLMSMCMRFRIKATYFSIGHTTHKLDSTYRKFCMYKMIDSSRISLLFMHIL